MLKNNIGKGGVKMAVPEYTKRAIAKYQAKFERTNINFPAGTREKIKTLTGESVSGYVKRLVSDDLERLENVLCKERNADTLKGGSDFDLSAYDKKQEQAEAISIEELQTLLEERSAKTSHLKAMAIMSRYGACGGIL